MYNLVYYFSDLSYNSLTSIPVGVFGGFTGSVVL